MHFRIIKRTMNLNADFYIRTPYNYALNTKSSECYTVLSPFWVILRGCQLSKTNTCIIFTCIKKNDNFSKETGHS